MSFAARQQALVRHLQWGPSRGRRRQSVAKELRDLVRDELQREVASRRPDRPAQPEGHDVERRPRYYWQERDDG
jgi:hypothetical protein